ncbi:MAG: phospho-sugar mutase, partial [Ruminococcus sp.]|nr:phospho-sugar mutase [Ruminococcus sp.]
IMITASHNPAAYNGYKAYGEDGCQMTDVAATAVYDEIQKIDIFSGVKLVSLDDAINNGMVEYVDDSVYTQYLECVKSRQVAKDICKDADLSVVYTPLNGTGNKLVRRVLSEIGVEKVSVVKEQELPDGNFTTCPYPNPEIKEALQLGLEMCDKEKPDLLLATDPDADRVGIAVKDYDGSYRLLTGNETGAMLTEFILRSRTEAGTLPKNPIIVKTIVTTKLINAICNKYGAELKNVLTGFKYIGEVILNLEKVNEEERFVFGFEESYGYLSGSYVRDKDAVVASMLICEMAAYYKKQGKTLAMVMDEMYSEYGYYKNTTLNFGFAGAAGMQKMADIMSSLRENAPKDFASYKVLKVADYLESKEYDLVTGEEKVIDLPKSNVLSYSLEGEHACIIRPSGTEPKIKLYITAVGKDADDAQVITDKLADSTSTYLS